jgi:hypothetical protein
MKKLLLAGLAIGALIAPAMAADMPVKAPPPPLFSWTGFYIGANAGFATLRDEALPYCINPLGVVMGVACSDVFGGRVRGDGFLGGGQAGYNWQIGHWVRDRHPAWPAEPPVDPDAGDRAFDVEGLDLEVVVVGHRDGGGGNRAEIVEDPLDLGRPVAGKGIFDAAAGRPAGHGAGCGGWELNGGEDEILAEARFAIGQASAAAGG